MKSRSRIPGALATAGLALAVGACAEGRDAPTAPPSSAAAPSAFQGLVAAARAFDDEGHRLAAAVQDAEQRGRLTDALSRLSRFMEAGDLAAARRALAGARGALHYVKADADRDALGMALDAAAASLEEHSR